MVTSSSWTSKDLSIDAASVSKLPKSFLFFLFSKVQEKPCCVPHECCTAEFGWFGRCLPSQFGFQLWLAGVFSRALWKLKRRSAHKRSPVSLFWAHVVVFFHWNMTWAVSPCLMQSCVDICCFDKSLHVGATWCPRLVSKQRRAPLTAAFLCNEPTSCCPATLFTSDGISATADNEFLSVRR